VARRSCTRAVTTLVRDYLNRPKHDQTDASHELLTARELEVVKLVAEGNTSDEIAELLVISRKTVDRHRANILEKLEMRDRVDVTRYAIRRGLVARERVCRSGSPVGSLRTHPLRVSTDRFRGRSPMSGRNDGRSVRRVRPIPRDRADR
jgi:DNA-binding CsgD family transcriptional regulator